MANSKTVLVVDDSRMARMMITKIIHSHHPEWEMLEAKSAQEALLVSDGKSIDIMTLDMNMPGMAHPFRSSKLTTTRIRGKIIY